jgi:hypothetical protein
VSGPEPQLGDETELPIGGSRGPAPELVGAALAVIVLAVVGTSVLAGGGGGPSAVGPSPAASTALRSVEPSPSPPVDPLVVELLGALNGKLVGYAGTLQREVDRSVLRTPDVASLIRQINATVRVGVEAVPKLGGSLGPDEPGGQMAALYEDITKSATETLGASIQNDRAYRAGGGVLVKLIEELPPIQASLEALLAAPPPTVAPSPTASPSPPPATATPIVPTAPTASPPPSGALGSAAPPPAADEQLENPGFEAGVGPPWVLLVAAGSAATVTADTSAPASGSTAARIDIAIGSGAYGGISLQQPGLQLVAGGRYTVSLSARSALDREIRIRIASTGGASYLARLAPVGAAWSQQVYTFFAPVSDANAVLEIDLGRSTATTWIDAVSFRPAAAGS